MLAKPECKVIAPRWGQLAHAANVTTVLLKPCQYLQVEFDEEGKACGVTSEGETARTKKVVCDPSYLPNKVWYYVLFYLVHNINSGRLLYMFHECNYEFTFLTIEIC